MLASVLIANRGEIARRIIRTAKRLGVATVAVYSEADARALHVREADKSVAIGPAPAKESYLRGDKIIAAAKETGAEAIHPGYGFLSENADFAEAVIKAGLIWIGPKPASIRAMGLKDAAKKLMAEAGVPVTPGYLGEDQTLARLAAEAEKIGFPVLIKAVAGGGGKGMRKVEKAKDFKAALESAKREALSAFGDDRVLLETYVERPRHIEVQVFGDSHGNIVHMFERDCSLQRRHQKVIEEAPAPGMDEKTRAAICAAAVKAAKAVDYENAGTIEFIADASQGLRADRIWFMEMNTRLQVEHPVTEEITGLDLVEWQLRVASGEKLPLKQDEIKMSGHAIEARLYAENPETGFLPSEGTIDHLIIPRALIRLEIGVDWYSEVSSHYDPLIAKVISHSATRNAAIDRLQYALCLTDIWPLKTNTGFLVRCLSNSRFSGGDVDTNLIAASGDTLTKRPLPTSEIVGKAAHLMMDDPQNGPIDAEEIQARSGPWSKLKGFRLSATPRPRIRIRDEKAVAYVALPIKSHEKMVHRQGKAVVFDKGEAYEFTLDTGEVSATESAAGDGAIRAPMPGKIVNVAVKTGTKVKKGDALVTLEAMKMEHALAAPFDGKITELNAKQGVQVSEGVVLVVLEKD